MSYLAPVPTEAVGTFFLCLFFVGLVCGWVGWCICRVDLRVEEARTERWQKRGSQAIHAAECQARADAQRIADLELRLSLIPNQGEIGLKPLAEILLARARTAGHWTNPGLADGPYRGYCPDWLSGRLMHATSELAEAFEALRDGRLERHVKDGKPEGMVTEIADAVIILMVVCQGLGLDLPAAILEKHKYNCTRPVRHGRKF